MNVVSAVVSWRACASSLAVLSLLVGVATAMAACGTSARPPQRVSSPTAAALETDRPAARVLARLERRQYASFPLLRTRPEGLPADTQRILRTPLVGMNWTLAQRMPVTLPGAYWLVPGIEYLCIVTQIPETPGVGTICAKTAQVLEHGFASISITPVGGASSRPARSRLVVGVAPDGARKVLVHTRGSVATAPVVDGLFVLRDSVARPPDFLALR